MADASKEYGQKLSVAHYRRAQPMFRAIKQLIDQEAVGKTRLVRLDLYKKSPGAAELANPSRAWRVNPEIAGGGLFHDLSPHQLDLMYFFFGEPARVFGFACNQEKLHGADDLVAGNILFQSGVVFSGVWAFNLSAGDERDECQVIGDKGMIRFGFFDYRPVEVIVNGKLEKLAFDPPQHVQQPMIEKVVQYFLGEGPNPCSGEEGVKVMRMIDQFTARQ
jgi:predicted dehydrogenase